MLVCLFVCCYVVVGGVVVVGGGGTATNEEWPAIDDGQSDNHNLLLLTVNVFQLLSRPFQNKKETNKTSNDNYTAHQKR